jgi:energy-coupling factor transporter ATP-binding protein EcfA2
MLKRLYADNIRSLSNFELRLGQVSTLVGPNGGGKSTVFDILQALQMFLGPGGYPARQFFGSGTVSRWDSRTVQKVEIDVEVPGNGVFTYSLELNHDAPNRNTTVAERLTGDGQLLYAFEQSEVRLYGDQPTSDPRVSFPSDPKRSFLPVLEARADNQRITAFKNWVGAMWLFKLRPDLIVPDTKQEDDAIVTNGSNYVSWFRTLQQEHPEALSRLVADAQAFIPGLTGIRLVRIGQDAKVLALDCQTGQTPYRLAVDDLSDGQRVLLVLYTILHTVADRASILAFDEPDNFVTDTEIQPWLSLIRERMVESSKGTLLVISHHPTVIDYLAPDQICRIWREDGPSRVTEVELNRDSGLLASTQLKLGAVDE